MKIINKLLSLFGLNRKNNKDYYDIVIQGELDKLERLSDLADCYYRLLVIKENKAKSKLKYIKNMYNLDNPKTK